LNNEATPEKSMQAVIKPFNPNDEFFIDEGCHIIELSNSPDEPDISIARARVEPGVTTRWHRLAGICERYVILEGSAAVEVDDLPARQVYPGDLVIIPPMCRQRISNTGGQDLIFLAICSPRFRTEAYEDIEGKSA
jgi:mannose-6-phosphate isomerase-like protein (cupin superfamily)